MVAQQERYIAVAVACLSCLSLSKCNVDLRDLVKKGVRKIALAQEADLDRRQFSDGLCFTAQEGLPGFGNCFFHTPGKLASIIWSGNRKRFVLRRPGP